MEKRRIKIYIKFPYSSVLAFAFNDTEFGRIFIKFSARVPNKGAQRENKSQK